MALTARDAGATRPPADHRPHRKQRRRRRRRRGQGERARAKRRQDRSSGAEAWRTNGREETRPRAGGGRAKPIPRRAKNTTGQPRPRDRRQRRAGVGGAGHGPAPPKKPRINPRTRLSATWRGGQAEEKRRNACKHYTGRRGGVGRGRWQPGSPGGRRRRRRVVGGAGRGKERPSRLTPVPRMPSTLPQSSLSLRFPPTPG